MSEMKYVMLREVRTRQLAPVIFSKVFTHSTIAEATIEALEEEQLKLGITPRRIWVVRSAGFYNLHTRKCFGDSETLKLGPDPDDERLIEYHDYTGGF